MAKKRKIQNQELPEKFTERMEVLFGKNTYAKIEKTFVERPTTFRVNTIKSTKSEILQALSQNGFKVRDVQWYKDAFILNNKSLKDLTKLDIYKEGKIYVQSLASMVPPLVLDPKAGDIVLDLTAAPGSKTSQIAALMDKKGELVANDNNEPRYRKLVHNLEHLGVSVEGDDWSCSVHMKHGAILVEEYENYFDKILLDAPCSSETRFIKGQIKTYGFWAERKIKEVAYNQRKLLLAAWNALKPGGTLVYSTCTFAPEENEVQISRLLERVDDAEVVEISLPYLKKGPLVSEWKENTLHKDVSKSLRILPDESIEGFFVACIKKVKK